MSERLTRLEMPGPLQVRTWADDLARLAHYLLEPNGWQGITKLDAAKEIAAIVYQMDPGIEPQILGNAEPENLGRLTDRAARRR